ncbi:MAG: hypothetical protein LH461_05310 [Spirochaetaceae bacterium]|nr:hypothetical protein [Spirochaetaceae bacterium]
MSTGFLVGLGVAVAVILGARLALSALPLRGPARRVTITDATLSVVGAAGLAFHCVAMFFRRVVDPLPGADAVISDIRALGTASIIWYVVPAVLVLLGLRRVHPVGLAVAALAFVAVGVTMYDEGPLDIHLAAIFTSVVVLALVTATLVLPPTRHLTDASDARAPRS